MIEIIISVALTIVFGFIAVCSFFIAEVRKDQKYIRDNVHSESQLYDFYK